MQRLGDGEDGEDVDAGMAEAKARRWRFVIKAYEPGAVEERPGQPKGPTLLTRPSKLEPVLCIDG